MLTSYEEFLDQHRREEIWLTHCLLKLGMPQNLRGFKCAVVAVTLCMEQPGYLNNITGELYPAVAKVVGTSIVSVERVLRTAIELTWLYGNMEFQHDLFGNSVRPEKGKPTNAVFIATVYYRMRREFVVCGKQDFDKQGSVHD